MDQLFGLGDNQKEENKPTFDLFSALGQMPSLPKSTPKPQKAKKQQVDFYKEHKAYKQARKKEKEIEKIRQQSESQMRKHRLNQQMKKQYINAKEMPMNKEQQKKKFRPQVITDEKPKQPSSRFILDDGKDKRREQKMKQMEEKKIRERQERQREEKQRQKEKERQKQRQRERRRQKERQKERQRERKREYQQQYERERERSREKRRHKKNFHSRYEEIDDFIVDDDNDLDKVMRELRRTTGYNPDDKKFKQREKYEIRQSGAREMMREDRYSTKMGRLEEEEDIRQEMLMKRKEKRHKH